MLSQGLGVLAQPITALANGFDNFVTNVGNFFGNLTNSLGNWFSDVFTNLQTMTSNIGNWFAGIGDKITLFAENVGDFFTEQTLKLYNLTISIGEWFSGISDKISLFAENVGDFFENLISYINPFSENFFLKLAFIPSEEFIEMNNERMALLGEQKFGFVEDFKSVFQDLKENLNNDTNAPNFTLTLPSKWGGGTANIINFEAYDSIRLLIKNIIRVFIWLYFIFRMYKRIPKIIY